MSGRDAKTPAARASARATESAKEDFGEDLQGLASKVREEIWDKWAFGQLWVLIRSGTLLVVK